MTRIIATSSEEFRSAGCQAALYKELSTLLERPVWDEETVRELHDAVRQRTAWLRRVFSIMGGKHAEKLKDTSSHTYTAWCVFASNNGQTSNGQPIWNLHKEVSQTPAAMQTARAAFAIADLRKLTPKVHDAMQAFLLLHIDRPATLVRLPKDWWPATSRFGDRVRRLRHALYRHPESGAQWDKHLDWAGWIRTRIQASGSKRPSAQSTLFMWTPSWWRPDFVTRLLDGGRRRKSLISAKSRLRSISSSAVSTTSTL